MKKKIGFTVLAVCLAAGLALSAFYFFSDRPAESFGTTKAGEAKIYTLTNKNGMKIRLTNYGATLVSAMVPNKDGTLTDVVLGYDDAAGYENGSVYMGATVGRVTNRIAGASFELNGIEYSLTANNNGNTLHGGTDFYVHRLWETKNVTESSVTFHLDSPDGDQGFPGNLSIDVTYSLSHNNEISVFYSAQSDADTLFAPTNHSYFNLNGGGDARDLLLQINADYITVNDENLIPTGELAAVEGTDYDFRTQRRIGELRNGDYDNNFAINSAGFREVASLHSEVTGITMKVSTELPGLQLYTAAGLTETGKNGVTYGPYSAVCLETQYFPDAIHHDNFIPPVLAAGRTFTSQTVYAFSCDK